MVYNTLQTVQYVLCKAFYFISNKLTGKDVEKFILINVHENVALQADNNTSIQCRNSFHYTVYT